MSPGAVAARVRERLVAEAGSGQGPRRERVVALLEQEAPLLDAPTAARLVEQIVADVEGLGPLEPLLHDPAVTDVLVNGGGDVWVERAGRLHRTAIVLAAGVVEGLIERVVAPLGLRADPSSPLVDARLPDGSRVHAVVPPLAVDGPCLTIRRFSAQTLPLTAFAPPDIAAFLAEAVRRRANLVVSGGTGAGKTTLLNALAAAIPAGERVITIEDAAELRLPQPHVVRLESRPGNAEGAGRVSTRELVRNALRMRPDRIVVGECRGPEAFDMLQAMNTGHDGSLTTCHANGPDDALRRIETMVLMAEVGLPLAAVREQVASAVDVVVQVARGPGGRRRVVAVAEVLDPGRDDRGDDGRAERDDAGRDERDDAGRDECDDAGRDECDDAGRDECDDAGRGERDDAGRDEREGPGGHGGDGRRGHGRDDGARRELGGPAGRPRDRRSPAASGSRVRRLDADGSLVGHPRRPRLRP